MLRKAQISNRCLTVPSQRIDNAIDDVAAQHVPVYQSTRRFDIVLYTDRRCAFAGLVILIAAFLLVFAGCATAPEEAVSEEEEEEAAEAEASEEEIVDTPVVPDHTPPDIEGMMAEERLVAMTLRQKIGQRFIIYVPRAFDHASTTSEIRGGEDETARYTSMVKETAPAGIIVYPWNYSDRLELIRLTEKLQHLSRYNALGAGFSSPGIRRVVGLRRFVSGNFRGFPPRADVARQAAAYPVNSARENTQGTTNQVSAKALEYIRSYAYLIGRDLQSVGINMNFAPVLDLSEPDTRSIIGDRSFGTDPETGGGVRCLLHRVVTNRGRYPHGQTLSPDTV